MKLKSLLLTLVVLAAPATFAASTPSAKVAAPDFQWWRDGRFDLFIHWGPSSITGKGSVGRAVAPGRPAIAEFQLF